MTWSRRIQGIGGRDGDSFMGFRAKVTLDGFVGTPMVDLWRPSEDNSVQAIDFIAEKPSDHGAT